MNMRTAGTCSGHSSKHFLFALGSVGLSTVVPRFASSRMIVLDLPTGTHPRHRRSATELTLMISLTAGLTTLTVFPRRLIAAFIVIVTVWMQGGELTNTARDAKNYEAVLPFDPVRLSSKDGQDIAEWAVIVAAILVSWSSVLFDDRVEREYCLFSGCEFHHVSCSDPNTAHDDVETPTTLHRVAGILCSRFALCLPQKVSPNPEHGSSGKSLRPQAL